jgi:hypothetical protein
MIDVTVCQQNALNRVNAIAKRCGTALAAIDEQGIGFIK